MQYTTKDSAITIPLNYVLKELRVGERVELEYNDTKGTQKKTEELLPILTEMWVEICC